MAIDDIYDYTDKKSVQSCGQRGCRAITVYDQDFPFGNAKAIRVGRVDAAATLTLRHSEPDSNGDPVDILFQIGDYDYIIGSWSQVINAGTVGEANLVAFF